MPQPSTEISIHTPARGVTGDKCPLGSPLFISIHTPARGVTIHRLLPQPSTEISIHTPARGVTSGSVNFYGIEVISIHTPARGVTMESRLMCQIWKISIHTPARGVTSDASLSFAGQRISIHTPARGVTTFPEYVARHHWHFNPHSRKGSDRKTIYFFLNFSGFFRHLTQHFLNQCLPHQIFNANKCLICTFSSANLPAFSCMLNIRTDHFYKISTSSTAFPRSTPILSTFVLYLFPR